MLSAYFLLISVASLASATPGVWTSWGAFGSECTACPEGTTYVGRTRVCIPGDDGSLCEGSRIEETTCTCPTTGEWEEWGEWSECDKNCGYCGTMTRERVCTQVPDCPEVTCEGDATETEACSTSDVICTGGYACCSSPTKRYVKKLDAVNKRLYCVLSP
ncbi:unnamed protein product [Caenorhabditis bovis]|uniref:Uncharacterized protein n=1 Tax=Caenorhabditis bovis TaxID=2654633 RepID=A0A8S1EJ96_9PELO|nr:unnamed protein product [Caenorhabditis bovis]